MSISKMWMHSENFVWDTENFSAEYLSHTHGLHNRNILLKTVC